MKLTKMSLVATLLLTSSAFAIDNVKVSGDTNIYYSTWDSKSGYAGITGDDSLFNKDNSAADASVNLGLTADLVKNDIVTVSAGASYTFISTLGLENNLVGNVWGGSHTADLKTGSNYGDVLGGAKVNNANWAPEAWIALSLNQATKSTLKLGRMELDTPLAFTEKWSIEKNTFEAAVLINQDIPDTTIVAAYVGNGNGTETFGQDERSAVQKLGLATAPIVNAKGKFTTFGTDGAYAAGVINNSFKPLTIQGWYYDLTHLATAYWLQADLKCQLIPGLLAGAQYASIDVDGTDDASGTYAAMLGYDMKDVVTIKAAYSQTSDKGVLHGANTATGTGASKLYTEVWWNYGYVTRLDTSAVTVSVTSPINGIVDLGVHYTTVDVAAKDNDLTELALVAKKSFGPLDTMLAYIYTDAEDQNKGDAYNTVQAYITLNF